MAGATRAQTGGPSPQRRLLPGAGTLARLKRAPHPLMMTFGRASPSSALLNLLPQEMTSGPDPFSPILPRQAAIPCRLTTSGPVPLSPSRRVMTPLPHHGTTALVLTEMPGVGPASHSGAGDNPTEEAKARCRQMISGRAAPPGPSNSSSLDQPQPTPNPLHPATHSRPTTPGPGLNLNSPAVMRWGLLLKVEMVPALHGIQIVRVPSLCPSVPRRVGRASNPTGAEAEPSSRQPAVTPLLTLAGRQAEVVQGGATIRLSSGRSRAGALAAQLRAGRPRTMTGGATCCPAIPMTDQCLLLLHMSQGAGRPRMAGSLGTQFGMTWLMGLLQTRRLASSDVLGGGTLGALMTTAPSLQHSLQLWRHSPQILIPGAF